MPATTAGADDAETHTHVVKSGGGGGLFYDPFATEEVGADVPPAGPREHNPFESAPATPQVHPQPYFGDSAANNGSDDDNLM